MGRERNCVQYKSWRNVGLPTGKNNLFEFTDPLKLSQRTATKGRDGNSLVWPQRPSEEPGARARRIRNPHSSGAQVSMGPLGGTRARKRPKALSGWTLWSLLGARVRPMSTVELRRGEQSALHCSGTRTLQVRSLPNTPQKNLRRGSWRPTGATLPWNPSLLPHRMPAPF